jgi:hypothetical protein
MKKKLMLFLFSLLRCGVLLGQDSTGTVYLKSGSIIKGTLVENNSVGLKIKIEGGSVFAFSAQEVEKISYNNGLAGKEATYAFSFSGGCLIGSSKNDKQTPLSLMMEHQIRVKSVSFGGLVGLEFLNEAVMPLGFSLKWITPIAKNTEFFVGCSGGYLYSLEEPLDPYNQIKEHNGGSFVNPEIGVIFTSISRTRLFVATGYRYAELHYVYNNWWYTEVDQDMYFDRFSVKFGLWFQ